uniref:Putative LOC100878358 [Megachile rotundata] n=1 Tax=Lepeophtheirus salmonis TaxID=72036 RepID=A0A0K2U6Z4_LEPSM
MSSFGGARPKTTTSSSRSSIGAVPLDEEEAEGNQDDDYVYMYCGRDLVIADLPKSLYELHLSDSHPTHHSVGLPTTNSNRSAHSSPPPPHLSVPPASGHHHVSHEQDSPDMDFLEMDFDEESVSESPSVSLHLEEDETGGVTEEEEEPLPPLRSVPPPPPPPPPPPQQQLCQSLSPSVVRSRSLNLPLAETKADMSACSRGNSDPGATHVDEIVSLNKLSQKETDSSKDDSDPSFEVNEDPPELTMIWTEEEVKTKATWSIETASTGSIAVMNVLRALNYTPEREDIINYFNSVRSSEQQTEEFSSSCLPCSDNSSEEPKGLTSYLFSCCMNSPNHKDLISVVNLYTKGQVVSRFFSTYPSRKFTPSLSKWLINWIQKGAIPVATINLREEKELFPGSWHYLMIFGVGPTGIYVTNPIVCAPEKFFLRYLSYPSEMVVDKSDILKRWHHETDLTPLRDIKDGRWREINVLGQVIHTLREECQKQPLGGTAPECIRIPCNHECGITLFMNQDSEYVSELLNSHELSETSSPSNLEVPSF